MFKKNNHQKGAAVVEFAIVLPLLLLLIFGIIEFSILLFDKALLTNASREGARVGIVFAAPRVPDATIQAVVNSYCANNLISFGNDTLPPATISRSGNNAGDTLTVTVNYNFHFLVFSNLIRLFGGTYGDGVPLRAVTVMRLE
ncbi:MAG: pilus assembly protein [Desulfuromonas sp.]|nr:pilus assembly protein [Desulfuromonas sp.]